MSAQQYLSKAERYNAMGRYSLVAAEVAAGETLLTAAHEFQPTSNC